MTFGQRSYPENKKKQRKLKIKYRKRTWIDNPFVLVTLCAIAVALVAAVRVEYYGLNLKFFDVASLTNSITAKVRAGIGSDNAEQDKEEPTREAQPRVGAAVAGDPNPSHSAISTRKPISVASDPFTAARGTSEHAAAVHPVTPAATGAPTLERNRAQVASVLRRNTRGPSASQSRNDVAEESSAHRHAISGRVLNQASEPVANIGVIATARRFFDSHEDGSKKSAASALQKSVLRSVSDENGAYTFRALADGEYEIRTNDSNRYATARIRVRAGVESADLRIVEQQLLRIHGVVENSDGEPVSDVRVVPSLRSARAARSDADGRYELSVGLTPIVQTVPVSFFHDDYRRHTVRIDAHRNEEGEIEHDVALKPVRNVAKVEGSVRASDDIAVAGVTVRMYSPGYKRGYKAVTDYSGNFEFDAVETAHDYLLAVRPSGLYQDYTKKGLHIRADRHLQIVLDPADEGILSGQMVDAQGTPIPGFTLAMRGTRTGPRRVLVTGDRSGRFVVPRAPTAGVVFETHSSPKLRITGVRPSADGEPTRVRLVLDWGTSVIQGRVVNQGGTPIAASEVTLTWSHTGSGARSVSTRRAATDGQGRFRFTRLGPGPHNISVRAPGHRGGTVQNVVAERDHEITVQLQAQASGLRRVSF